MTFFNLSLNWNKTKTAAGSVHYPGRQSLNQAPTGRLVRIVSLSPHLPVDRRAHLHAYGVIPGYCLLVTQQSPVTVVRIEHTEIALENELAGLIQVEPMD